MEFDNQKSLSKNGSTSWFRFYNFGTNFGLHFGPQNPTARISPAPKSIVFLLENYIFRKKWWNVYRDADMNVVPRLILFWVHVWSTLGSILGPKSIPKLVRQIHLFRSFFGEPFSSGLIALQVPRESLLERLMLVLGAPKIRKAWFPHWNVTFFAGAVFRGSWRPSWAHLGASWPVLTPKLLPKWTQNWTKNRKTKMVQKMDH